MNLTDLFNQQRILDAEIEQKHPVQTGENRLAKKLLALSVELGECANEWRGFKFWSNNQEQNTKSIEPIFGTEEDGMPYQSYRESNPLLEEYIDCLHFALSIGNDYSDRHGEGEETSAFLNIFDYLDDEDDEYPAESIVFQFNGIYNLIGLLSDKTDETYPVQYALEACSSMINNVIGLGEMLGFTWEDIMKAYAEKNKINHERQANAY